MSKKVTYQDIVEQLSESTGKNKQLCDDFIKELLSLSVRELKENDQAVFTNFGAFKVKEIAERTGKNPQTGEELIIPAHKKVNFKSYKALRETVNAPYAHLESTLVEEESSGAAAAEDDTKSKSLLFPVLAAVIVILLLVAGGWYFMGSNYSASQQTAQNDSAEMIDKSDNDQAEDPASGTTAPANESTQETKPAETETTVPPPGNRETAAMNNNADKEMMGAAAGSNEIAYRPEYRPQNDEWYWDIARKMYGNPEFWPLIFAANKTTEDDPDMVYAWRKLTIPPMDDPAAPSTDDLNRLAEAASLVAEAYRNHGDSVKSVEYQNRSQAYLARAEN